MELKEKDVYQARWKERSWGDQKDHCFEGLLVVLRDHTDKLLLVDSFWGVGKMDEYNKKYTLEDAKKHFDLTYYCNLDEIEPVGSYDLNYYANEDVIFLHDQHACVESCKYYYIKKGATRNRDKMIETLNKKIEESKYIIERETRNLKENSDKLAEVISGNLDIYI